MEKELFGAIRDNYFNASKQMWKWRKYKNFFIRSITLPWILVASIIMKIIGLLFGLGVVLDIISIWLMKRRNSTISMIDSSANNLRYSATAYFSTPIKCAILAPIVLLLGIIPKWSTTLVVAIHPDIDVSFGTEHGYFKLAGKSYANLAKMFFVGINKHGIFFTIIAFPIAIIVAPISFIIACFFFALIILDWFGWLVSMLRKFVVSSSEKMANASGKNILYVVLMPIFLILFVPIYIALLLIPKIATYDRT